MKFIAIFFLVNMIAVPIANAQDILSFQQRTSFAYKKMMQARKDVDVTTKMMIEADSELQRVQTQFEKAQEEYESAKNKLEQANLTLEQAERNWEQASAILMQEWGESERR